jgi:nicotinamidase-related amidase
VNADELAPLLEAPAVVTIDLHRGHLDPEVAPLPLAPEASAALMGRVVPALASLRRAGVPVVHVVTYYRTAEEVLSNPYWAAQWGRPGSVRKEIAIHNVGDVPGLELMPGVYAEGDHVVRTKKRYDCFIGTDLEVTLRTLGARTLLVTGVNTNSCVLATSIAASVKDFRVVVMEDLVDSMMGPDMHTAALEILAGSFAFVTPVGGVLDALGSGVA